MAEHGNANLVEDPLAEELLSNRFPEGSTVSVDRDGDHLIFQEAASTEAEAEAPVSE